MTKSGDSAAGVLEEAAACFGHQGGAGLVYPALESVRKRLGFVPNHVAALRSLPRLIEAEWLVSEAFLYRERALTRRQKEIILLAVGAANENAYAMALPAQALRREGVEAEQLARIVLDYQRAGLAKADVALLDFALRLGRHPTWITPAEIEELRALGLGDEHILEAVLTTSWGGYLSTLTAGLGVEPNFAPPETSPRATRRTVFQPPRPRGPGDHGGPYLRVVDLSSQAFPPFEFVRKKWGFIPNLFKAQTIRPDLIEAELSALNLWLNTSDVLLPRQKEFIFLAISAANLNTYCVAAHCEILRVLGVPEAEADQIALDYRSAGISEAEKKLLDACVKLARRPAAFCAPDLAILRARGFSTQQILEAVAIAAITNLVNTLNTGLGVDPDFERHSESKLPNPQLFAAELDHMEAMTAPTTPVAQQQDKDAACVARIQAGDPEAFEELVRRHGSRVYRTLAGILRQDQEVEDAVQDTFVRAFQHIGKFQGRSRFSTWLTRIAINTGLQRLRGRKDFESLDESPATLEQFRPRQVQPWQDDPEKMYSKTELRDLILKALLQLPLKYRVVVILRDRQQLSIKETAAALGVDIPAVKTRLFRGRLMLREALSPYFTERNTKRTHD